MKKRDVLIIKTGYTEVLDNFIISRKPSWGDILRTTPLLHLYKDDNVFWLTDKEVFPLLEKNPYINELLELNFTNSIDLLGRDFDVLINLEKNSDICKFANKINAWSKYGFRFDKKLDRAEAYDRASEVLDVSSISKTKKENKRPLQELLFEMVGSKYGGEEYILGYSSKTSEEYDVALNTVIGLKWTTKAWPINKWNSIEDLLKKEGYKVTRQDKQSEKLLSNLYSYIDWINKSKLIVTNDSLGMHLGLALNKNVIALFGSSSPNEVYFYDRGKAILPEPIPSCLPCFQVDCEREHYCMNDISVKRIYNEIKEIL